MAQAFVRLGIATTVLQKGPGILPRDEPDLVDILVVKLRSEGSTCASTWRPSG